MKQGEEAHSERINIYPCLMMFYLPVPEMKLTGQSYLHPPAGAAMPKIGTQYWGGVHD